MKEWSSFFWLHGRRGSAGECETLRRCFITSLQWQALHKQGYNEPGLWGHKLTAWESGTDCSWVTKNVTLEGPVHVIICAGLQTQPTATETHHLQLLKPFIEREGIRPALLKTFMDPLLPFLQCTVCAGHLQRTGSGSSGSGWRSFSGVSLWSFLKKEYNKDRRMKIEFPP